MKSNEKNQPKKSKKCECDGSTILYVGSLIAAIIAVILLVNNVRLYNANVAQYVAQGYPKDEVVRQLKAIQLMPGICEPIALYGGIALILYGIGMINEKVSRRLVPTTNVQAIDGVQKDIADAENVETSEKVETDTENIETSEKVETDAENAETSENVKADAENVETAAKVNETTDDIK
jgi:hypothetical protein